MADFYFFTEPDKVATQTASEAFQAVNQSAFRITHQYYTQCSDTSYKPRAFAITNGNLLVLRNANPLLVNIIFQPDFQPSTVLPDIKYIIYKGILKESLVDANDNILNSLVCANDPPLVTDTCRDNAPTAISLYNNVTRRLWLNYDAQRRSGVAPSMPPNFSQMGDERRSALANTYGEDLEDLFYADFSTIPSSSGPPGTLAVINRNAIRVNAGDEIGRFPSQSSGLKFGIEIMYDNIHFKPKINSVANAAVETLIGSSSSNQIIAAWEKEQIINYLDPCAFYGMLSKGDRLFTKSDGTPGVPKPFNDPLIVRTGPLSKADIYNNILSKCYNKNKVYIDIRNRFNYSYGLSNCGQTETTKKLKLFKAGGTSIKSYNTNGWPILVINNSDITPIDATFAIAIPSYDPLNEIIGYNIENKSYEIAGRDNTFRKTKLTPLYISTVDPSYSRSIDIALDTINDGGNIVVYSSYIKIWLVRHPLTFDNGVIDFESYTTSSVTEFDATILDYLSPLFPFNLDVNWSKGTPDGALTMKVANEPIYVDDKSITADDFFGRVGIAKDSNVIPNPRVTFFFFSNRIKYAINKRVVDRALTINNTIALNQSFINHILTNYIQISNVPVNVQEIDYYAVGTPSSNLRLDNLVNAVPYTDPAEPNEFTNITRLSNFKWFQIKVSEYNDLVSQVAAFTAIVKSVPNNNIATDKILVPVYLYFQLVGSYDAAGNINPVPSSNINDFPTFCKYEIVIVGYPNFSQNNLGAKIVRKHTGIYVRSTIESSSHIAQHQFDGYELRPEGFGFSITNSGDSDKTLERKIDTSLYVVKSCNLTYRELFLYKDYFEQNIKHVWNSNSNVGLTAPLKNKFDLDYPNIFPFPHYTNINGDDIKIKLGAPYHLEKPKNKEVGVFVEKVVPGGRSGMSARRGFLQYNNSAAFDNSIVTLPTPISSFSDRDGSNVPAHEFGHVLGLGDRYCFFTYMTNTLNPQFVNEIDNDNLNTANVPLYLTDAEDTYYHNQYRWLHNLMSTQTNVPADATTNLGETRQNYKDEMFGYDTGSAVFITPVQWNIIENYEIDKISTESSVILNLQNNDKRLFLIQRPADFTGTGSPNPFHRDFLGLDVSNNYITDNSFVGDVDDMTNRIILNRIYATLKQGTNFPVTAGRKSSHTRLCYKLGIIDDTSEFGSTGVPLAINSLATQVIITPPSLVGILLPVNKNIIRGPWVDAWSSTIPNTLDPISSLDPVARQLWDELWSINDVSQFNYGGINHSIGVSAANTTIFFNRDIYVRLIPNL